MALCRPGPRGGCCRDGSSRGRWCWRSGSGPWGCHRGCPTPVGAARRSRRHEGQSGRWRLGGVVAQLAAEQDVVVSVGFPMVTAVADAHRQWGDCPVPRRDRLPVRPAGCSPNWVSVVPHRHGGRAGRSTQSDSVHRRAGSVHHPGPAGRRRRTARCAGRNSGARCNATPSRHHNTGLGNVAAYQLGPFTTGPLTALPRGSALPGPRPTACGARARRLGRSRPAVPPVHPASR